MSKPEKKLQDDAIEYLEKRGVYHLNLFGDGWSGRGKPDLLVCINGRFIAFELKVGENDLSDAQKLHRLWIQRAGGLHYAPYTYEEFTGIVEELLDGR